MGALSDRYKTYVSVIPMVLLSSRCCWHVRGSAALRREFEQGTHVFGLTQSISRRRWWATKILVGGGPVAVLTFALGLIGVWTLRPPTM